MTTIVAVELGGTGANNTADARAALGVASSTVSNAAYTQANSAYGQANLAYTQANSAYSQANSGYTQANNSYGQANSAYAQANNAYGQANLAYTQANNAYGQANSAYAQANLGYTQANTATTNAGNAHNQANNAYGQANLAYTAANNAVLRTGDTMTGRLGISNTTNNVVTSGIILTGNRNYVAGDNGGIQIFATGSGGTIGTHDYGAIKFYARGFTGAGDGGGGIVSLHVGGSSSNPTSNGMFLQADGGLELAQNIKFYTGTSAERMRIDVSGNVGIGINSPTAKLHLYGAGSTASNPSTSTLLGATLALQDSGGNSGNGGMVMFGASQGFFAAIKGFITEGGANTQGDIIFATRNASTDAALTERLRIMAGGNVGIGTTNPDQQLVVGGGVIQSGITGNNGSLYLGGLNVSLRSAYAANVLGIYVSNIERMRIDSSGNVGVGTSAPGSKLDVYTATASGGHSPLFFSANNSVSAKTNYVQLGFTVEQGLAGSETGGFSVKALRNNSLIDLCTYDGAATVQAWKFFTEGSERLRITSNGFIGVGTTTPNAALHITTTNNVGPILRMETTGNSVNTAFWMEDQDANVAARAMATMDLSAGLGLFNLYAGAYTVASTNYYGSTRGASRIAMSDNIINFFTANASGVGQSTGTAVTWYQTLQSSNANFIVYTNNGTERFRITETGNVGIGAITTPSTILALPTTTSRLSWGTPAGAYALNSSGGGALLFGVNGDSEFFAIETHLSGTGHAERFRITEAGNVGIGTASPGSFNAAGLPLVVGSGGGNQGLTIFSSTTGYGGIHFADGTAGDASYRGIVYYQHSNDSMQFWTSATERMRIDSSGNVGIGTTSPETKFHVNGGDILIGNNYYLRGENSVGSNSILIGRNSSDELIIGDASFSNPTKLRAGANFVSIETNSSERMRITSTGDVQIGSAVDAGNTLRYFDVYNTNTGSSAGAIMRLISADVAGVGGLSTLDIVKYKNGVVGIHNGETNAAAYTAFNVGSTERFRITPTGITTAGDRLAMGNVLTSTKTLDTTKWYRIATLSASNQIHEVELRVRILASHANFVIKLSKGTGNWVAQAYRAGYFTAPGSGYSAINKVRIYDVGVNSETHIEIQVAGATESRQYEVIVVNSVTPTSTKPTLVDFTDQGTGSVGVEFLVTEVNASWGTPSGQNVVFRDNGNVGIGTGTTLPGVRLDVAGSIRASQSITIGNGGGTYQAGSIYSDSNWGMIFRAAQASPAIAQFSWHNSADTVLMRMDSSGHTTHVGRFGVNNAATDATFVFAVASGRTRLQANSEQYALGLRYNTTTGYYYIGASNSGSPALQFSNNAGTERARLSDAGGFSVGTSADPGTGAIYATGEITAFYSDDRLKNKLGNIDNALSKVLTLNGFYYEPNETAMDLGYEKKKQVGVSAQEVREVLPEVVVAAPIDAEYMTVHYHKLVPLLIEAIKELNTKIEDMQKIIESKS